MEKGLARRVGSLPGARERMQATAGLRPGWVWTNRSIGGDIAHRSPMRIACFAFCMVAALDAGRRWPSGRRLTYFSEKTHKWNN